MTGSVLAIDVGSSSVRAALYDSAGVSTVPVTRAAYPHRAHRSAGGAFDPYGVADALREVLGHVPTGNARTVVLSSLWHSVIAVDDHDRPMSDAYSWESTEPSTDLPTLREHVDEAAYRDRTGSYLHPSYPAAAIWMLRSRGIRPVAWTDLTSWLVRTVLGARAGWSREIASGSAMWDQASATWDLPTLEVLGVSPRHLGDVWTDPSEISAPETGLVGARILPTLSDGVCNSVGMGAVGPSVCALTAGTSGSLRLVLDGRREAAPRGLWRYQVTDDVTAIGGAISNAGNVLEWWSSSSAPDEALGFWEGSPPAFDGLVVTPDLAGRRGPDYRWDASASVRGLRLHHTLADVRREMLLGVCATYAELTTLMLSCEPRVERFIASGGVVERSPAFAQLLADATGHVLEVASIGETSLRGAALRALRRRAHDNIISVTRRYEPRQEWFDAVQIRREAIGELR